jgi:hypothetical protein
MSPEICESTTDYGLPAHGKDSTTPLRSRKPAGVYPTAFFSS